MREIEKVFNQLIDAFDTFLNIEEKEIGCLEDKEHERVVADRNYYSQLCVEKLNGDMMQLVTEHQQKTFPRLIEICEDDGADVEGMGNRRRKRYVLEECEM